MEGTVLIWITICFFSEDKPGAFDGIRQIKPEPANASESKLPLLVAAAVRT
jgi:hypothetical protein